jgi:hypothetical protein
MTTKELFINFVRDLIRPRTIQELMTKDLREARISKMQAEQSVEYASSVVEYNRNRIARLEKGLKTLETEK